MNQKYFQASAWFHGMTLTERITSLKATSDKKLNVEVNSELAQKRMQRWRKQSPFTDDSHFVQRLDMDKITEDEFLYLLGEPIEAVQQRNSDSLTWLENLARAFSAPAASNPEPLAFPEKLQGKELSLFLHAIRPLICQAREQVQEEVQKLSSSRSDLPFDPKTIVDLLFVNLPGKLLKMCSRTMVLELQIASLQGHLQGNTPQERFYSFLEHLCSQEGILALLQEYPVLARQLTICIQQWVRFSLEFIHHLYADWDEIKIRFSPGKDPGQLVAVKGNQGDSHQGGRSVEIASFSSGFQLVYKPRSLATDIHFQQLLTWLNERGDHLPFRTLKILNRDFYGWIEFVTPQTCNSQEEVKHFYERQGGYLALLYALEATDFHNENLIAVGEHPVLIDLESLFHPRLAQIDSRDDSQQFHLLANKTLNNSVLRIGLLPQRIWSKGDDDEGIDLSGLGGKEGQLTPDEIPYWEEIGTDQMRLKRKRMKIPGQHNRPTLNDTEVNLLDYSSAISAGFTKVYQVLLKHRDELFSSNGPLASFASDEVRVILRPTRIYGKFLRDSFHPKMLLNALERERLFDRLWFGIEHQPHLVKVIPAERKDLWNGDVPLFRTRPNSRDLLTSSGEQIADFFPESGMDLVQHRLQQLNESDLALQIRLINSSLATLVMASEKPQRQNYTRVKPQSRASREQLLTAAVAVGDRLAELALRSQDNVSWIGLRPINKRYHCLVALGWDFYDGLPGISLFLAYLGVITEQERYTSLAQAALTTLRGLIKQSQEFIKSIGSFDGWGGIIYTLTHLGMLWDEPALLAEAQELVKLLPPLIEEDKGLDIIAGSAGCIISLLNLYHYAPSESTLAAAIQCGDHLIAKAQKMVQGIAWVIPIQDKPLTGLAHGAAGIAWALLELSELTGEQRFRTAALEAIAYERSLFLPELGNWPDLRNLADTVLSDKENQHQCMIAWCHGAPGIGLARLCSLPHLDDAEIRAEINTALKTTLTSGFGYNHSLCHGDLGNLELLLQASQTLDDPQWGTQVNRFAAIILENIDKHGWLCGVPLGVETPGLMNGLAGIGYELLRLAEPERIPSVLILEPPRNKLNQEHNIYRFSKD